MVKRALLLIVLAGWLGTGATLNVGSGAHAALAGFSDLNDFLTLVNRTIAFVEGQPNVEGEVPPLEELRTGVGFSLGELVGDGFGLGLRAALASWETATSGSWTSEGSELPVSLRLEVEYLSLALQAGFQVVPGAFTVGLAGGWGWANLGYACEFNLPPDFSIPFQPPGGTATWRAHGPVGEASARVLLPLGAGFYLGLEAGLRLAPLGVPQIGGVPLDLDADGEGETLDLSGMWFGLCVQLSFEL